jgi:hypothetical protein
VHSSSSMYGDLRLLLLQLALDRLLWVRILNYWAYYFYILDLGQGYIMASRFMTDEEIAAEQEKIRQQAADPQPLMEQALEAQAEYLIEHGVVTRSGFTDEDDRKATPLDLLSSVNYVDRGTREARYDVCKGCPRLFKATRTCKECGCFMAAKTWLKQAECPLDKWNVR